MNLVNNFTRRAQGGGYSNNCSFVLPRLVSSADDVYLKVEMNGRDEEVTLDDSECLVGRFCPFPNRGDFLALADEDGYIIIQDTTKTGKESIVSSFRAHENAIFDVAWMTGYKGDFNIVTASGDKTVAIWDVETLKRQCVITCHEQSLRTVSAHPDAPGLLATGGRDGKICIHDHRCDLNFPVSIIVGAHAKPQKKRYTTQKKKFINNQSVTSLILKDEFTLISGGFTDGFVKVWDLRRTYTEQPLRQPAPVHSLHVGATVTSLVLPSSERVLYVSCTNNTIFAFDAFTYCDKPMYKFMGHSTNCSYSSYLQASVSPCGEFLACGSTDSNVYIWPTEPNKACLYKQDKIACVKPIIKLEAHANMVTCVQWAPKHDELKLASLSDDTSHRIWRVGPSVDCVPTDSNQGYATILEPAYFRPTGRKEYRCSVISANPSGVHTASLPSFVADPASIVHKCSPRVSKQNPNWLSALSPLNSIPSAGKVVKVKRPNKKRKSAKKLQLLSPHFKSVSKPRVTK